MDFAYCRVSTQEQNLDLQLDAMKAAGIDPANIFTDKVSGATKDRPQFNELLKRLRSGDTLTVWKLDRAGRNLKNLIELVEDLKRRGVNFVSLKEQIDTTTATGSLIFNMFAALAQFERDIISERTTAGLEAARARGRVGGRPSKDNAKIKAALSLYHAKTHTIPEITKQTGISKSTLYRYIEANQT